MPRKTCLENLNGCSPAQPAPRSAKVTDLVGLLGLDSDYGLWTGSRCFGFEVERKEPNKWLWKEKKWPKHQNIKKKKKGTKQRPCTWLSFCATTYLSIYLCVPIWLSFYLATCPCKCQHTVSNNLLLLTCRDATSCLTMLCTQMFQSKCCYVTCPPCHHLR